MREEEIIFREANAAARSLKNLWTRMASTYKCIHVCLSRHQLIIKPHRFMGWAIYLLRLDLYHEIPLNRIKTVESKGQWLDYGKIEVTFAARDGERKGILLYLKKHDAFMDELKRGMAKPVT